MHDYLLVMRGAERTFSAIAGCFPHAPVCTLLYDEAGTHRRFATRDVHTSALQRLPFRQNGFRALLPAMPSAVQSLPTRSSDIIISSSSAFAHGVRAEPGATHISYCHSPFRYAWHERDRAMEEAPPALRPAMRQILAEVRRWDLRAARRVTHYIANSELTRRRMQDFWGRDAAVISPPVEVERFTPAPPEDYFLVVGELVRHKRIDLALEAAALAGQRIKVVGTGPELARLSSLAGPNVEFLGRVPDAELASVYARAKALVVPGVEEFGIAAVEAQAAGRPVLAVDDGGAQETVVDGMTGVLVEPQVDAMAEAMRYVDFERFSSEQIVEHASGFSTAAFVERFSAEVTRLLALSGRSVTQLGPVPVHAGA